MTSSVDTIPTDLRVLLTGARHQLGFPVREALEGAGYIVSATDDADLTDPVVVAPLVEGVAAIVHLEPLALVAVMPNSGEVLDAAARGTHVLLKAALDAGVPYVVQGSTLAVMDAYEPDLEVTEQWRPRPRPEPRQLAPYLAELVGREFTRDVSLSHCLQVVCLRFATLDGPDALSPADAAVAVVKALSRLLQSDAKARGHRWNVLHIDAPSPGARYSSHGAARAIGYGITQDLTQEVAQ